MASTEASTRAPLEAEKVLDQKVLRVDGDPLLVCDAGGAAFLVAFREKRIQLFSSTGACDQIASFERRHEAIYSIFYSPATDGILTIEQDGDGRLWCLIYLHWRASDILPCVAAEEPVPEHPHAESPSECENQTVEREVEVREIGSSLPRAPSAVSACAVSGRIGLACDMSIDLWTCRRDDVSWLFTIRAAFSIVHLALHAQYIAFASSREVHVSCIAIGTPATSDGKPRRAATTAERFFSISRSMPTANAEGPRRSEGI